MTKKIGLFFILSCLFYFTQAQSLIDDAKAKYFLQQANEKLTQSLFNEAIALYQQADSLSLSVFTAKDYNNMAGAYYQLKYYNESLNACKKAILLDSLNKETYFNLGIVYLVLDSNTKAIFAYKKAIQIDSVNIKALYNLAAAYKKLKDYETAISYYEKIIEIDVNHIKTYVNMGVAYGELGNIDMLYECFKKAARLGDKESQEFLTKTGNTW